ncbi:MAG: EF-P lysine aminoacylase GenX [SAR324 cluster bacterium]|nr:EF-P lysine aminoacylase GenX [SAR324 cluster bacterium]
MTFQSRKIPYRTHQVSNSNSRFPFVPQGRYAGRVFEIDDTEDALLVRVFLEEKYYQFHADRQSTFRKGDLIAFDVDSDGHLSGVESLFSSADPPESGGDIFRWRQLGHAVPRMNRLKQRHKLIRFIRSYFDQNDFLEVDTPLLVKAASPENQLDPFAAGDNFLITSPEFQMKRMLVGGFEKIYQITSCFRDNEVGRFHNPEFTMLEWYRAYDCLNSLVRDLEGIFDHFARFSSQVQQNILQFGPSRILLNSPWERRSVAELFDRHLGLDIEPVQTAAEFKELAVSKGFRDLVENVPDQYEQVFFRLWDRFESQLGLEVPLLVYDWPMPLASFAQRRGDRLEVAERMEMYIAGIELANGYGELTDADEQRLRFEKNLEERKSDEKVAIPLDHTFLESIASGMPPSAGMALGIDRLAMLFTGAQEIRDVMCFAYDER